MFQLIESNGDFILDGKIGETLNRPNIWRKGEIRGTVNFGMRPSSNASFDWQVRDVVIKIYHIKQITLGQYHLLYTFI